MAREQNNNNIVKIGEEKPALATVRESNLELYRIITMLLIVAHHYVVNSGLTAVDGPIFAAPFSWRSIFLLIFGAWGKTGINCFVLITGYFMCRSQISARKFAKLFFEWMLYRLVLHAAFWITGYEAISIKSVLKAIVPISSISTNFTSCFILFFLFIPFLSVLVHHLTERMHFYLLLLSGFLYIILGTLHQVTMNYVSWFAVLFLIASYIRMYPKKTYMRTSLWGCLTMIMMLLSVVSIIACTWLGQKLNRTMPFFFVTDSNTILAVLTGVSSFLFFKNLKIPYSRVINTVAASTFGVLCIHAHSDTMRQWLWKDVLNNVGHYDSSFMPLYAIGSVLGVFILCTSIDQLRIHFVEKPFFKLWDRHWDSILTSYKRIESKIFLKIGVQK